MKALKPSKTAIAIAMASAALVTGCGQNEEVSQAEQEVTTTASAAGESITPPAETITNPDTGATAQTGANTDVEYGTASNNAESGNLTAERSGPPAGETTGPHTTTDMLAVSPAPAGVNDSIATSDAAEASSTPNVTERTTPDAGAGALQQTTGSAMDEAQQSADAAIGSEQQIGEQQTSGQSLNDEQQNEQQMSANEQQSNDTSGAAAGAASDTWITTKVKTALLAEDQVSGTDIQVETANGEVMLSGFVESQQQIEQAKQVAQQVEGVRQVTEKLEVKQQQ